ncbi:hypothetical protein K4422_12515 [Enterococcus sp. SMC-9]|nr:hypothetical protein [Enterococcus sp. SMC-9]
MFEVDKVYKLTDAHPPAFGKAVKVTTHDIWNEIWEDDEKVTLAWGDWYQWNDTDVYCIHSVGFETRRLVPATQEEIEIYEKKVMEYQSEVPNDTEV